MKIALFTENCGAGDAGGMDIWMINLINHWPGNDEFFLIYNYDHPGLETVKKRLKANSAIITYKCITTEQIKRRFFNNRFLALLVKVLTFVSQYGLFIYHFFYFRRLLRKIAPDRLVIVSGGYPGGSVCRPTAICGLFKSKWGKPVMVYHNEAQKTRFPFTLTEYLIDRLLEKSVSHLITVSKANQDTLQRRPGLQRSKKKIVIYNGTEYPRKVNTESLGIRKELGISEESKILLMLATYEKRKGHDFLFRSLQIIRKKSGYDIHLIAAGSGYPEDTRRLPTLLRKYGLEECVHLVGFRSDIPELLSQSDLLVVPSQCKESFGLSIIEAMSYKVPVVATNIGGIPEILQNERGGFAVENDVHKFAEKVVYLLKEEKKRQETGMEGFEEFMKRFTADKMVDSYYQIIR